MQRLLVPFAVAALAAASLAAQDTPPQPLPQQPAAQQPAAEQGGDPTFVVPFGSEGEPGSYRVKFTEFGAGVMFVQAMDHFATAAAARKSTHDANDYMLLVWAGGHHSFRLTADPRSPALPPIGEARWQHEITPENAVHFWLDLQGGVRLHKTFSHRPQLRTLVVTLGAENRGDAPTGTLYLDLGGPAIVNTNEASLYFNPSLAIGVGPQGVTPPVRTKPGVVQPLLALPDGGLVMAGTTDRFFAGFAWPIDDAARRAVVDVEVRTLPGTADNGSGIAVGDMPQAVYGIVLPVATPGVRTDVELGFYLGPKSFDVFESAPELERFKVVMDVDLDPPCCFGITVPGGRLMAELLLRLLGFFERFVGNWGIAIMMLTVLVRGLLAPLNYHMQKSMREYGKRMAVVKPKLEELQRRHGNDKQAYQQAMLQFQREHKLLPPLGGCLPIFLTMPVYIGLFTALRVAYGLRQERFLFIADLSQPDRLFELPFWPHNFNILPLVWITLFFFMQRKMPLPTDPQQRQVQQIMRYMPIVFGVLLYNYASGLMVYMVTSMLWTYAESAIIRRKLGPLDPSVAGMAPAPVM